ncbi:hypothetical protein CKAH01_02399 [Colletotrichum kahawae]|uniref:Uncharacterized protein n=1 Tax=Colletotrichum kahawae TaxID=34407 RepID=A0AAD9Y004_COLKA|nr:hypothetical protein CKAH01_02399 [Colletotrichum kahawae]
MKKKSMSTLASLAPRRRDRGINTNRDRANEPQEVSTPSVPMPIADASPTDHHAVQTPGTGATVDRLASALLESTIYDHPNGLASHPSVLLCNIEPLGTVPATPPDNPDMDAEPRGRSLARSAERDGPVTRSRLQASKTTNVAPDIPRKSSRRRAQRVHIADDGPEIAAPVPRRLFPQSRTTILDTGRKRDGFIAGSTTAPLGGLTRQAELLTPNTYPDNADPHIVNNKIAAMLAATRSLKPPGSEHTPVSSTKPSRFRPKNMMSKVRKAFDVFQPKPATPESKIRGKISLPIGQVKCDLPNPAEQFHVEQPSPVRSSPVQPSPISSMEIRVNEGENLNKQKPRSMVGGRILRKRIHDDGKSLRSGGSNSPEDPFSEPRGLVRTPTPFEHQLKVSTDSTIPPVPPVPSVNPFDSENDDLEGFLSEKPACASTPRNRSNKQPVPVESPSTRYTNAGNPQVNAVLLGESSNGEGSSSSVGQRKLNFEGVQLRRSKNRLNKKHPSPTKEDMTDMPARFREFTLVQINNAPSDKRDELVRDFSDLIGPGALTPRDKNIPMKTRSVHKDTVDDVSNLTDRQHTRESSVLSNKQSRIPRPVEPSSTLPTRRFGPQRQPANLSALEVDELQ